MHRLCKTISVNISLIIFLIISSHHSSCSSMGFPSVVTFNKDYVSKAIILQSGGTRRSSSAFSKNARSSPSSSSSSEYNQADSILPICCSMETDDVMFFECQNTLSPSSKETVFKQKTWVAPRHLVSTKMSTKFRFENSFLKCNPRRTTVTLSLNSSAPRGSVFLPDGYFKHDNEYYRPDEYCISGLNKGRVEVEVCQVNCNDPNTPCIQKCCGTDQIYSFGYGDHPRGCVNSEGAKWFPTLYHDLDTKLTSQELIQLNPHIIQKFPTSFKYQCRFNKTTVFPHGKEVAGFLSSFTKKPFRNLEFRLRKDGWLLYPSKKDEEGLETPTAKYIENYCIDGVQDYGESTEFSNTESNTVLFLCSGGVEEGKLDYVTDIKSTKVRPKPINTSRNSTTTSTTVRTTSTIVDPTPVTTTTTTKPATATFINPTGTTAFDTNNQSLQSEKTKSQLLTSVPLSISTTPSASPTESSDVEEAASSSEILSISSDLPEAPENGNDLGPLDSKLNDQISPPVPMVPEVPENKMPDKLHAIPQPVSIVTKPNLAQIRKKKPALSQTTFNHNNNQIQGTEAQLVGSDDLQSLRQVIPTCCDFSSNVNDGFTHHCRNRRMDLAPNGPEGHPPTWNIPAHFMTKDKGDSFLLKSNPINCGHGKFQFQGFIHNFEQERANSPGEKKHGILEDGFLKYDNEFYGPSEYCINGLSPRIIEILICKPDCSMWETPCVKKCCGLDEVYNLGLSSGNRGCQPLGQNESRFTPTLYKDMLTPVPPKEMKDIQLHYVQNYPPNFQKTCYNNITLAFPFSKEIAEKLTPADSSERGGVAFKHLNFRFRKDGRLIYTYPISDGTSIDSVYDREFCVDAVRDYGETVGEFSNKDHQTILFICASQPH